MAEQQTLQSLEETQAQLDERWLAACDALEQAAANFEQTAANRELGLASEADLTKARKALQQAEQTHQTAEAAAAGLLQQVAQARRERAHNDHLQQQQVADAYATSSAERVTRMLDAYNTFTSLLAEEHEAFAEANQRCRADAGQAWQSLINRWRKRLARDLSKPLRRSLADLDALGSDDVATAHRQLPDKIKSGLRERVVKARQHLKEPVTG